MGTVLNIRNLKTYFYSRKGIAKAVNGLRLSMEAGQIVGVVGESGCGKSMTGLSILQLVPYPGKIVSGDVFLGGQNLFELSNKEMRSIRGDRISMIFQEPMISLNPAFTIEDQLVETIRLHRKINKAEASERAVEMLRKVEIPAPERRVKEYPHQMSGGMRQRVMIAESLLLKPEVLIADEPTTALDVTIQAQVLDIMYRLTQESGTAIMLITHNLGLIAESANKVLVMYTGKVVEAGPVRDIFENASHPYTQGLLHSIPLSGNGSTKQHRQLYEMKGIVPNLMDLPQGCTFHPRCPAAKDICRREKAPWCTVSTGHGLACWLFA